MTTTPTLAPDPFDAVMRFPAPGVIHDLRWSANGSQLAIAAGTRIHLYDASLTEQHVITLGQWPERIAFHPSLPIIGAALKDGSVHFWNTASGEEICKFTAHSKGANSLAFQPGGVAPPVRHPAGMTPAGQPGGTSGDLLATTGTDIISRIWNISSILAGGCDVKPVGQLIGSSFTAPAVIFSADGQMLALVDIKDIYLRESQTRKLIAILHGDLAIFDIALSPDDHWLAAAQNNATITVWDVTAKPRPTSVQLHFSVAAGYTWRVDFNADGSLLAAATSTGEVLVWQAATRLKADF